jgi:hypothetical protein
MTCGLSLREVVAALMCSTFYFDIPPRQRLELAKRLCLVAARAGA